MSEDITKELLEQILAELYAKQTAEVQPTAKSYLAAQDGQFLGAISADEFDRNSMLNKYGPYGSPYSATSIFNEYSDYGSRYGQNSVNNPYCSAPPKLVINANQLGFVTVNQYVANGIPTEVFLYALENSVDALLSGRTDIASHEVLQQARGSYIESEDGTFLGKIDPSRFDNDSVFNRFGNYGSRFSPTSIFNKFSVFGNQFNDLSPYNRFSTRPPKIYVNGKFIAFLTKNNVVRPRVDPDELLTWAEQNVRKPS